jgi:RHS repeat-associated protein
MVKHNEMAMQTLAGLPTNMPVARVEFDYDYMSRRVGKTVYNWGSNGWQEVSTAAFLYDAWNLIAEQTSVETNFFTFGLDLSGSLQGAGGIGGLVSAVLGTNAVCYTFDGNGNVSELINCAGGKIDAHYEYSPFGETIVATGELAKDNPFRFSSKYTDDETTLVYYGYRYYSPSISKWLSNDPLMDIGSSVTMAAKWQLLKMLEVYARVAEALMFNEELPDDIRVMALFKLQEIGDISRSLMGNEPVFWLSKANNNWVLFCGNNPVNFVDPLGLCSEQYRSGDEVLQNIRTFFDAGQQVADSTWWPDWYIELTTMLALHSGPWSPLDFHAQDDGRDFIVNGSPMSFGEFGNYVAGYSAGYGDTPGLYMGVRIGGFAYAALLRAEHWTDRDSVPAINQGFRAGRAERNRRRRGNR